MSPSSSSVMLPCHAIKCKNDAMQQHVAFRLLTANSVDSLTVRLFLDAEAPLYIVNSYSHRVYYSHCMKQVPCPARLHTFLPPSLQPAFHVLSNS